MGLLEIVRRDESVAIWREYRRTRDVGLRNGLVLRHMGLVHHLAARYAPLAGDASDDLVQEGCLGLIRAVERFRPEHGVQFSTYAYPVISGYIKNYLRRRRRLAGRGRVPRLDAEAEMDSGEPGGEELIEPARIEDIAGGDPEHLADRVVERLVTGDILSRIPKLERTIISQLFYDDLTQREIARRVARSASRVSRIIRRALERLRLLLLDVEREEGLLLGESRLVLPRDALVDLETGLFSRAHLHRSLRKEIRRAKQLGAPLTLALFHVNGVDAASGPGAAAALAKAAGRIYRELRVLDHVFRAGPDELAVVFSLPAAAAARVCGRLGPGLRCGLATYPTDGGSAADLLAEARGHLDAS